MQKKKNNDNEMILNLTVLINGVTVILKGND